MTLYDAEGNVLYIDPSDASIPAYWKSHMDGVIATLKENENAIGIPMLSFIFITDVHWQYNAKVSPRLIKYIKKNYRDIPVICGGDIVGEHESTKADAVAQLMTYLSDSGIKLNAIGNHDTNKQNNGSATEAWLSDSDIYSILIRENEGDVVTSGDTKGYYFDNASQKARIIVGRCENQNANIADARQYIMSKIADMPEGWTFVVVIHDPTAEKTASNLCGMIAGGTTQKGFIIGGHTHQDAISTSNGITVIVTRTDAYTTVSRAVGASARSTTNEQSFDVVQVDTVNRTVYLTRVGYAEGRETKDRTVVY